MPSIVIMAGGTGGHVFPGLAVANELAKRQWQIDWFGTAEKMEAQLVPKHGFDIHFLKIAGVRGKGLVRKLMTPFSLFKAVMSARALLKNLKPDVVLGMGGYVSGPGGIAAYTMGIPIVLHEQNAVFGLTNRVLAKLATTVLSGFDTTKNLTQSKAPKHTIVVGNPIREGFNDIAPLSVPHAGQGNSTQHLNILVIGGSLGALALNETLPDILCRQHNNTPLNVTHQTGKGKHQAVQTAYDSYFSANPQTQEQEGVFSIVEFIDDMEAAYAWADILICRAGALTVAEVAASGRAAIFVPLPIAVDDHQTVNAESLSKHDAAIVIQQNTLAQTLPEALAKLCGDHDYRQNMATKAKSLSYPNAAEQVANHCEKFQQLNKLQTSHNKTDTGSNK